MRPAAPLAPWALSIVALGASSVGAQDFDPQNAGWNGLRDLLGAADEAGVLLDTPAEIDVSALDATDALLIVHPTEPLPRGSLTAFLRAGGRVAVADDFGHADAFLRGYGIARHEPNLGEDVLLLRGNPALPIARARARHPLMEEVDALVANHPTVLTHQALQPIAAFDESSEALVLAGAIEEGRLAAIGDPSLFINNMMRFRGNRRFARNLLRYLDAGRGGRILLATPGVPLRGRFGDGSGPPLERLNDRLRDAAHADTPPIALTLTAAVLAAILLVFAVSALPTRSPYSRQAVDPIRSEGGGFLGRVEFFTRRRRDLVHPLMVYKFELEAELVRRLGLEQTPRLGDAVRVLQQAGLPAAEAEELRRLLLELDDLRRRLDHPPGPPRVSPHRLRRMVDTGERLLARIAKLTLPGADEDQARYNGPR